MATAPSPPSSHVGTALKEKVLSTPEVLAQSVANMAPSAAMALLPLLVFMSAGNALWLSFVLGLAVLLIVGYCAAQFATRINSAGSFYVWVTRALGPGAGSAAGWGLVLGYLFTGIATVIGFEIYADNFLTGFGISSPDNHVVRTILYLVGGLGPAVMSVMDIRISQRTAFILETVSVGIILILCVATWVHNGTVLDTDELSLKGFAPGGMVVGIVLAIFAFVGFESAGALGQEARNPARSVPRAILWSCGVVGLFYLIVSYTQLAGFGDGGFGKATAPLPQLASVAGLGWLGHFIAFGITCSMFACCLACLTAGSRMLLSLGRDGLLPGVFTRTSRKTRAPSVAIWTVTVPMIVIPVSFVAAGSTDTVLTGEEGTMATYGFMLAYALVSLAAPVYLKKIGTPKPLAWVLGIGGLAVMAFVFYVNWIPQAIPNGVFPALAWPYSALPYVFIAWTAVGAAWYLAVRLRKPEVVAGAASWGEAAGETPAAVLAE
ncbi:MAG: APC family permease [Nocardiopsaceae bacterium]|nr:APC family permease [Nocardiopsaceae bacterium]